jgi:N-acetylmuramoyl-L-alanine amidase
MPIARAVPRLIRFVVVHHAEAYDWRAKRVVHQTMEQVRAFHMRPIAQGGKGYRDIGYHRFIEQDGAIRFGRNDNDVGAHVKGFNANSLGVCCSGDGDFEPFNDAQLHSLVKQCAAWCLMNHLPPAAVLGHRETDEHGAPRVLKTCPGLLNDINEIRKLIDRTLHP